MGIPPCCNSGSQWFSCAVAEIEVTIQLRANPGGADAISACVASHDGTVAEVDGWMALLSVLERQLEEARRRESNGTSECVSGQATAALSTAQDARV